MNGINSAFKVPVSICAFILDKISRKLLSHLILKNSWPTRSEFGERIGEIAFKAIMHTPHKQMISFIPYLRRAIINNEAPQWYLAAIIDRILVAKGKAQIYGYEVVPNFINGKCEDIIPVIVDFKNVNRRRARIGLTLSIEEYAKKMNARIIRTSAY